MNVEPLPKWVMKKYSIIWNKFQEKEFTYKNILSLFNKENINVIRTLIAQLRKSGWLSVRLDSKDSRIRVYKLKDPAEAIKEMGKDG